LISGHLDVSLVHGRLYAIEIFCHRLPFCIDVVSGTLRIPQTTNFQPDIPGQPIYTFNSAWTPALAGNLAIDNLLGYFYVNADFVPFRPARLVRSPSGAQSGIRIHADGNRIFANGVRVIYPFPDYARLNPGSWGELLRFQDVTISEPMSLDGEIGRAIFAGHVKFTLGAGINVHDAKFDAAVPPVFDIKYRLQGGLPRLYLGTTYAPMDSPSQVNLVHRGASEKSFIQRHSDRFRQFSHEVVCSNESFPCHNWEITFTQNATEDPTQDHSGTGSTLKTLYRLETEVLSRN
jgi:hypothetical protein